MKAAIILFPGSNRERDALRAVERIANAEPSIVWHGEHALPAGTDLAVLPGGFAYGDYLRCGAIAARAPVMDAVRAHAARGGLVLGICNGFQILVEAGLLPGVLMRNANLRFVCRMQHLTVERVDTPFTSHYAEGQIIKVAIAHGEGNYVADTETIARIEGEGRVAFRYCDAQGGRDGDANPNGSVNDIAGIYSENSNVLGLMPHPENVIDPLVGGIDGRGMFESLAAIKATSNQDAFGHRGAGSSGGPGVRLGVRLDQCSRQDGTREPKSRGRRNLCGN
jgi:phosphoribosylformylglycinamidine synthase subunit PurQ / glutaminase